MLISLSIKNYALIDELQVSFDNGLTIITGETGAGKSILLGGLSLILGKRADLGSIKNSSEKCIIEAAFDISRYNLQDIFDSENLDYEKITIIRREILPSGKSRAFVNDTPVNLDSLQALGERLLDIHSQYQTLQLTNDDFQFQVIDALADNKTLLSDYSTKLSKYKTVKSELAELQQNKAEAIKEHDYNLFLLNELESAKLNPGEMNTLEDEQNTLSNVEAIRERLLMANQLISNEEVGIVHNLTELKNQMARIAPYSKNYHDLLERINSSLIELDDVFAEIEKMQEAIDADPKRLEEVNAKLMVLHNLMSKHSAPDETALIKIKDDLLEKVSRTEDLDSKILHLQEDLKSIDSELKTLSQQLHSNREQTIPALIEKLEVLLSTLGMPNAKFNIELATVNGYLFNGSDELKFLFSANKGIPMTELKKAASGGELSRIMLAIKSILSQYTQLPTIMFDEIDTGVSGEISNKMATIMQQMGKFMQVFAITHLPQIAAKGNSHFKVFKTDVGQTTQTHLKHLEQEERIVEIAQMLGGTKLSESAIAHAKQLMN